MSEERQGVTEDNDDSAGSEAGPVPRLAERCTRGGEPRRHAARSRARRGGADDATGAEDGGSQARSCGSRAGRRPTPLAAAPAGAGLSAADAAREVKGQTSLKPRTSTSSSAPRRRPASCAAALRRLRTMPPHAAGARQGAGEARRVRAGSGGRLAGHRRRRRHGLHSGRSSRATTRSGAPRRSASRWISATIRFPRKSRPISAMIRPHDLFCSCRT